MTFVLTLTCTIVACFVLREPLRRWPIAFYLLAIAVDALLFVSMSLGLPRVPDVILLDMVRKCMLPLALFSVVMYIGVLPKTSHTVRWLRPIRAELSIVAWILSLGHMVVYLVTYTPHLVSGHAPSDNVLTSFMLATGLSVLLLVLGVTSFNFVRRRMSTRTWKRIQKLAYPFFDGIRTHSSDAYASGSFRRCACSGKCGSVFGGVS